MTAAVVHQVCSGDEKQSSALAGDRTRAWRRRVHKYLVPEVIFGVGTLNELGGAIRALGGERPFVVSDPGVIDVGWVARAEKIARGEGLDLTVWHGVTPNPKDHEIERGSEALRSSGSDVVVAVGGGSCIDAAKAISLVATSGGRILDYVGIDRVSLPLLPMVMVPSTGGTGADVSQFCVITDTSRRVKCTIAGRSLVPDVSIIDPSLLTTMPDDLTANTGLDALSHAVEAYVSRGADFLSDAHALAAIRAVAKGLLASIDDPADLGARECVAGASLHAGLAFSTALLGATHAISHQVGGALDLAHGLCNAILLPHVIRFNAVTHPERYVDIAAAFGLELGHRDPREAAESVADEIRLLADKLGIPSGLGAIGVRAEDIDRFAPNALLDAYITTNPRPVSEDDVRAICLAAL
ncbi:MAG: iron-containing alcohol dehydrogenase [Actinomycetota bacterium]|nr:iron-containing alcohol dehydrogenase [Actinomycetota bacterium]MDA8076723.1 iron-containing alcohol dehydrogenase [Actinomycetota bacterium]